MEQLIVAESRRYSQFSEFYLGFGLVLQSLLACGPLHAISSFFVVFFLDWTESRLKKSDFLCFLAQMSN